MLYDIRKSLRDKEGAISRRMSAILKKAQEEGIVDSDAGVSVRDGKMLIPVSAANKKRIAGFIYDESATGKTAFIRRLAQDQELVRSVHVCVYDRPSTRTARDTLKDLAYVLAKTNRRYLDYLKDKPLEQLPNLLADGLFEYLFIEPLKTETQKYLLVIDGLDEMDESAGFNTLMQLFRQHAAQ